MKRSIKYEPLLKIINNYLYDSPLPANINYFYNFGSLLGLCLIIQIITGILLAMFYVPTIYNGTQNLAFESVEYIMREVHNGWLIRYIHANGASLFFMMVYMHIFRSMWYGAAFASNDRKKVWYIGVIIFLLMIITAFLGYSLVRGGMSLWGATVITSLLSTIPYVGQPLVELIWGGYSVGSATLNRFYSIHYLLPFIITGASIAHLISLHSIGGTNPIGTYGEGKLSKISFNPYFTIKDILGMILMIVLLLFFVFYFPNLLGHPDNYVSADSLVTPPHIVPEWYLLPFYAILRAIPNKMLGVLAMVLAILGLMVLPSLHNHVLKTSLFRPIYKISLILFINNYLLLLWIGSATPTEPYVLVGQLLTLFYFGYLFFFIPLISAFEFLVFFL